VSQQTDFEIRQEMEFLRHMDEEDALIEAHITERQMLERTTVGQLLSALDGLPMGGELDRLIDRLADAMVRARAQENE
jgi:hypothetical protein